MSDLSIPVHVTKSKFNISHSGNKTTTLPPTKKAAISSFILTTFRGDFASKLSNDPGKKGSNFFCCGAIRFPHIETFSFLRRECINLATKRQFTKENVFRLHF